MGKKFSRFYLNKFTPITKFESKDVEVSRRFYRAFTFFGAITCGFMSFRWRRMKISMIEAHEAKRESEFLINIFNDAVSALLGFTIGNLIACDYIYKHRTYVVERLFFEQENSNNYLL
jgi:hypothetical protein